MNPRALAEFCVGTRRDASSSIAAREGGKGEKVQVRLSL